METSVLVPISAWNLHASFAPQSSNRKPRATGGQRRSGYVALIITFTSIELKPILSTLAGSKPVENPWRYTFHWFQCYLNYRLHEQTVIQAHYSIGTEMVWHDTRGVHLCDSLLCLQS